MAGTLVIDTLKSSTANPPAFQNTSGTEIGQLCRAWVNFDGTTGTRRASFNVSSVTRNGAGDYTVTFANAMPDTNFSGVVTSTMVSGSFCAEYESYTRTVLTFQVRTANASSTLVDKSIVNVAIFR